MKTFSLTLLLTLVFFQNLTAQENWCGTPNPDAATSPVIKADKAEFERYYNSELLSNARNKKSNKYIIPVVFHIIHNNGSENVSNATLKNLIAEVNKDLKAISRDSVNVRQAFKAVQADAEIELRLAKIDPDGNCTNGVTRTLSSLTEDARDNVKSLSRWPNDKYLNIWLVKSIQSSGEGTTLGYAYFPASGTRNPRIDGIVMRADRTTGNTLTHELGHYLNLYHTFQSGCGSSCNTTGDRVCDTPPTANRNFGCPTNLNSCSNESPDGLDQVENYMDYSDCMGMFTEGQKVRMHSAIKFYRSDLVSQANLEATGVDGEKVAVTPIADFYIDRNIVCEDDSVGFTNISCGHNEQNTYRWVLSNGSNTLESNKVAPFIRFEEAGRYEAKLVIQNENGQDSIIKKDFINVLPREGEIQAPYSNGLNQLVEPPANWKFSSDLEDFQWELNSNGTNNSKCLFIENYNSPGPKLKAEFTLPGINIQESSDQILRYNVAYARKNRESNDALRVYLSFDCGQTWSLRKIDVALRMYTTFDRASYFTPTEEDHWVEQELDLSRFDEFDNILIKFEFESGNGNNIYLDDIRIGTETVGLEEINWGQKVHLYPNPANNIVYLQSSLKDLEVRWFDVSGKSMSVALKGQEGQWHFDTQSLQKGVYFVELINENQSITKKVIIE